MRHSAPLRCATTQGWISCRNVIRTHPTACHQSMASKPHLGDLVCLPRLSVCGCRSEVDRKHFGIEACGDRFALSTLDGRRVAGLWKDSQYKWSHFELHRSRCEECDCGGCDGLWMFVTRREGSVRMSKKEVHDILAETHTFSKLIPLLLLMSRGKWSDEAYVV